MGERRMYKAHEDNCLQCCLSYILDVDIRDVLDVAKLEYDVQDKWFNYMNGFLRGTYNKEMVQLPEGDMPKEFGIAIVEDMNWGTHSLVIDDNDAVLWDPNPNNPVYTETIVRIELRPYLRDKEL